MNFLNISLLAIIQGLTELLPISSTAHLILFSKLIDIDMNTYYLSILHLGTTLALIIHFWQILTKNLFTKEKVNMYLKIVISVIPVGIVGLLFESVIEERLRGNMTMAISLIVWGIAMIVIERRKTGSVRKLQNISWKQSFVMGVSQILALIPGTSRSGISTIAGILTGLDKYTAIQYSFLLGLPLLLGASLYGIYQGYPERFLNSIDIVGILLTATVTFLALSLLKKFSKKKWLTLFGIYRVILGIILLILL